MAKRHKFKYLRMNNGGESSELRIGVSHKIIDTPCKRKYIYVKIATIIKSSYDMPTRPRLDHREK